MIQNRTILIIADWQEVIYGISNSPTFNDLEWPQHRYQRHTAMLTSFYNLMDDYNSTCDFQIFDFT